MDKKDISIKQRRHYFLSFSVTLQIRIYVNISMIDICCIGHITRDRIITPEQTVSLPGGTSYYFAKAINHLPQRINFELVTKVAEEDRLTIKLLQDEGTAVRCFNSRRTVFFENRYGENANNRTQRLLDKADPFTIEEVKGLEAKVFHLGSLLSDDFSAEVIELLREKGQVSVDVQGFLRKVDGEQVLPTTWKDMKTVLPYINILKLNEHEMEVVAHDNNPYEVAKQLNRAGVDEVLITLGSYGSVIGVNEQCINIPAYHAEHIVDATGCGDTYSAGYLYAKMNGASYKEAGQYAAAMCTLKLQHSGAFDKTEDAIMKVIHDNNIVE